MVDAAVGILSQEFRNWTLLSYRMQQLKAHIWQLNKDNVGVLQRSMLLHIQHQATLFTTKSKTATLHIGNTAIYILLEPPRQNVEPNLCNLHSQEQRLEMLLQAMSK